MRTGSRHGPRSRTQPFTALRHFDIRRPGACIDALRVRPTRLSTRHADRLRCPRWNTLFGRSAINHFQVAPSYIQQLIKKVRGCQVEPTWRKRPQTWGRQGRRKADGATSAALKRRSTAVCATTCTTAVETIKNRYTAHITTKRWKIPSRFQRELRLAS